MPFVSSLVLKVSLDRVSQNKRTLSGRVQIADRKPAVEFVNTGTFLTSEKDKRITFTRSMSNASVCRSSG